MNSSRMQIFNRGIWAFLLLILPITSSPLIARSFGGTSVAPLSIIPLVIVVITLLIPSILRQKALPRPVVPLILFSLIVILSIAFSSLIEIPSFRGLSPPGNSFKDLLTLAVGICFYLTTIYASENSSSLKFSLYWLNLGGLLVILFAFVQFLVWKFVRYYPEILRDLQDLISTSGKLYDNRVTAFALEPSWLAHQMNVLYLPIWVAFTIRGFSIYKKRVFKKLSFENLLLAGGLFTLAATLSRIGWLSTGGLVAYLLIRWANVWKRKILSKYGQDLLHGKQNWFQSSSFNLIFWLFLIIAIGLLGFAGTKLLSLLDPKRMASVFALFDFQRYGLLGWANRLEMAERFLYWMSGFYTFLAFPLLGVGLGNVGYFFINNVNSFGFGSPEIMQQLLMNTSLVNAKNLWVRLLAETGIIGFASFVAWFFYQLRMSILLEKQANKPLLQTIGLAGILISICFIIEGFSMDTFGLPYYWIGFGLVIGAYRITQKSTAVPAAND